MVYLKVPFLVHFSCTHLLGLFFLKTHHVPYYFFADETQIYLPLKPVSQPCDSKTEILVSPPTNKQPVTFFTIPLDLETHFLNLRFKVWVLSLIHLLN